MDESFDSRADTEAHIARVGDFMNQIARVLKYRAEIHDASKLVEPEKSAYDVAVPEMRKYTYGSAELKAATELLGPALDHHFAHNSHHPEHYGESGIAGMDLADVVEMLCDWRAAAERSNGGMDMNAERYGLTDQLAAILSNTLARYLW